MQAIEVIRGALQQAHGIMEYAIDGLTDEQLHHKVPGGTIQAAGPIYFHTLSNEDYFINVKFQGGQPIYQSAGWAEKIGIDAGSSWQTDEWATSVRIADLALLREYAQAVYAASDAYLASVSADDLDELTDAGPNRIRIGEFLSQIVVCHAMVHGAEIAALKGIFGLKGAPY